MQCSLASEVKSRDNKSISLIGHSLTAISMPSIQPRQPRPTLAIISPAFSPRIYGHLWVVKPSFSDRAYLCAEVYGVTASYIRVYIVFN